MVLAAFLLAAGVFSTGAGAADLSGVPGYPVLFVHGFCSGAGTWQDMTTGLLLADRERYGVTVTEMYSDFNDVWGLDGATWRKTRDMVTGTDASRRTFALDFNSLQNDRRFDPIEVAQVSIGAKSVELKQIIDEMKRITGQPKVIVIGHSMGGLVTRYYMQIGAGAKQYEHDIAALITIDTPHAGSFWASGGIPTAISFGACVVAQSTNRTELAPGSSTLQRLNGLSLPADTPIASIASWQSEFSNNDKGDFVVSYDSQNLLNLYGSLAGSVVFLIDNPISRGSVRDVLLHTIVHRRSETIGIVKGLMSTIDRLTTESTTTPTPVPPGAPSGLTATTGATTLALAWNAPASGGSVTSYVIEGGSRTGLSDIGTHDTGSNARTLTLNVGAGRYFLRVRAKGPGGTGAPSNEVVVTLGSTCVSVTAPTDLTAGVSGSTVSLAWKAPATGTATSYVVEAGSSSGASNLVVSDTGAAALSLSAANVANGLYFVRVRAKNACGTSAASNEVQISVGRAGDAVITAISPASPIANSVPQTLHVIGQGLQQGLSVWVASPANADRWCCSSIRNVTSTGFDLDFPAGRPGSYTIRVDNVDGTSSNTLTFTVQPPTTMTVTSISPACSGFGTTGVLGLSGTGFAPDFTATLITPTGVSIPFPITFWVSTTFIQINGALVPNIGPAALTVRIANPNGVSGTIGFRTPCS